MDDSRFIRGYLSLLLTRCGISCTVAENGQAGLECLRCLGPYDVALIDWNMPFMSGLEMIQAIRRDSAYDHLKILMVTVESDIAHIETALLAGADEYLLKPFDEFGLVTKLELIGLSP